MAVLPILRADLVGSTDHARPDRSRCSLRNRLPLERSLPFRGKLLIDLVDHGMKTPHIHVPAKLRLYSSRMHRSSAHTAPPMPLVKRDSEQNIRRLRSAI